MFLHGPAGQDPAEAAHEAITHNSVVQPRLSGPRSLSRSRYRSIMHTRPRRHAASGGTGHRGHEFLSRTSALTRLATDEQDPYRDREGAAGLAEEEPWAQTRKIVSVAPPR